MSLVMSEAERVAFLGEPRVGVIAISRDGRGPLAVPIWYRYARGEVCVWMERDSVKYRALCRAGRFTLVVQSERMPYKYVSAEGPVVDARSPSRAEAVAIAGRYLAPPDAEGYVDSALGEGSVLVSMRPERWLSNDQSRG
ncbi:pyridoxamine 5'-phosphate oxidase [Actinokineospora guangxiensis]|uniref:Pyridoxamine 5'-phosphate oxidase n=1 Tax=Actinokineospora guangxiensis TaxID=1490288 RepID=A0ABW0EMG2_9PSEU